MTTGSPNLSSSTVWTEQPGPTTLLMGRWVNRDGHLPNFNITKRSRSSWFKKPNCEDGEQVLILDFLDFQFFPGSTDRDTPDTQLLGTPVSAQYVRILPLEFSGQAGLRFDVLGCTPDCKKITLPNSQNYILLLVKIGRDTILCFHR